MATPRYLSTVTFKQWWKTETAVDDSLIEAAINAAEQAIDKALGRRMVVADASSERLYRPGRRSSLLLIHDATAITAVVENGSTLTEGTHYQLEPLNGLTTDGEPVPYHSIVRLGGYWYYDGDKATVGATGTWGWSAIPAGVVESCKIVTADMLSNRDMRNGLVAITEAGGVGSRENRTVRDTIKSYQLGRRLLVA